jgi:DNA-binding FadR family transcriptional regulator
VLPRTQWNMLDEDVLRWTWSGNDRAQMAQHLMQLRRIVEPAACEIVGGLGARRRHCRHRARLPAMDAAGMDAVAYAGPDLEFHRAILSATGNPFLVAFGATIEAALRMSFELSTRQPGAPRKSLPLHRAVLDQIWARKPAEARKRHGDAARRSPNPTSSAAWPGRPRQPLEPSATAFASTGAAWPTST